MIRSSSIRLKLRLPMTLPSLRFHSLLQKGRLGINQLKQIHSQLIENGLNSDQTMGKLIECYCAASIPESSNYARLILKCSDEQRVFIRNVMIRCMAPREGIQLFTDGVIEGELFDKFTYIFMLGACARSSTKTALWKGRQVHGRIFKIGFVLDVVVQTTGIHFYAKCEDCRSARQVFDEMPVRTGVTWTAMISGYCSQGKRGYDNALKAMSLFREMLLVDGPLVRLTGTTMVSVLAACARLGDLVSGKCVHGRIEKTSYVPENNVFLGTSLVDMYSKCGCVASAMTMFNRMKSKNVLTWSSMMAGLATHGQGRKALEMLNAMVACNIQPNALTFTSLLFACCHAGLIDEGIALFNRMTGEFNVTPGIQHYGCMVDLLGRVGRLQEAYEFILKMPIEPDMILWRSFLSACNIHGDVEMGEKVGKLLVKYQLQHEEECRSEDFVALSNIYALGERWGEVELVRNVMKHRRIELNPGSSSVQVRVR